MKIQAEVSIYPLRTESLSQPIQEFCEILDSCGLEITTTNMSTLVSGDSGILFKACEKAFDQLSSQYQIVMNMKISNACPLDGPNA
ncbi:hypothetical protein EH221_02865 [bacterium]|nr:MAG: hypothetical protein EH221_02865 [bacterium]